MIEFISVKHHIQKSILDVLMYKKEARFRDLRPSQTDTNLFTYHLNTLVKAGMIDKKDGQYTLSANGLSYVDRVSTEDKKVRVQPKIITMLVVQNSDGDILLQRRTKQPYIDTWTLPYGKLHIEDTSTTIAAQREAFEKLGLEGQPMTHAGDCYVRVRSAGSLVSTTLVHVFRFESDAVKTSDELVWARPHKLHDYALAPAVQEIMTRTFFNDTFYFEDFEVDW